MSVSYVSYLLRDKAAQRWKADIKGPAGDVVMYCTVSYCVPEEPWLWRSAMAGKMLMMVFVCTEYSVKPVLLLLLEVEVTVS